MDRRQGPTGPWVGTAPRLQINVCPELHPGMSPNQTEASPERPLWGPLPKRQLPATSPTPPHSGTTLPSVCQRGNGSVPGKATSMWSDAGKTHTSWWGGGTYNNGLHVNRSTHIHQAPAVCWDPQDWSICQVGPCGPSCPSAWGFPAFDKTQTFEVQPQP